MRLSTPYPILCLNNCNLYCLCTLLYYILLHFLLISLLHHHLHKDPMLLVIGFHYTKFRNRTIRLCCATLFIHDLLTKNIYLKYQTLHAKAQCDSRPLSKNKLFN